MFLFLVCLWIMFNGKFTIEIAVFGIVIALAVFLLMCRFMDYSLEKEKKLFLILPDIIKYLFLLIWEIVKANMATAHLVLNQKIEVEPQLICFTTPLKTDTARVILADSITLTPGTITVELEGGEFKVHCLDRELAEGIEDSVFVRNLLRIEEKILK
ncbi:sodium:proton antiporter [bacterium C-53]|nr:sodium:proton antiporter [Lachnospiraceae bacterium]NBI02277.1 sodium:proton antiporter [Lachnospiraceae bacterium]RKJ11958.1 sodium:proton antiporter [bacterium C-53]